MVTSAIHLSTETFLAALRLFFTKRGKCKRMYTDNGTNFITTLRSHREHLCRRRHTMDITCSAFPQSAVRCVRLNLRQVIGNTILTFEQISAVVNSRSLCYTSDTDDNYLSSAHFHIGSPFTTIPEADLGHITVCPGRYWQSI